MGSQEVWTEKRRSRRRGQKITRLGSFQYSSQKAVAQMGPQTYTAVQILGSSHLSDIAFSPETEEAASAEGADDPLFSLVLHKIWAHSKRRLLAVTTEGEATRQAKAGT